MTTTTAVAISREWVKLTDHPCSPNYPTMQPVNN